MTKTAVEKNYCAETPEQIRRRLKCLISEIKTVVPYSKNAENAYVTLFMAEKVLSRCLSVSRETLLNLELLQANDNEQLRNNLFKIHEDLLTGTIAAPTDIKNKNMK